jgi:hypothetical protein
MGRKILSNGKKNPKGMLQRSCTEAENFVSLFAVWFGVCKLQKRMKLCKNQLLPWFDMCTKKVETE